MLAVSMKRMVAVKENGFTEREGDFDGGREVCDERMLAVGVDEGRRRALQVFVWGRMGRQMSQPATSGGFVSHDY